jgi:putative transposase
MSFIDAHDFAVGLVLRVFGISPSVYYRWRAHGDRPSRRRLEDVELLERICKIRAANEYAAAYGSPRIWLELREQGVRCGRKRVERIMRENGLTGAPPRGDRETRRDPVRSAAPDTVERRCAAGVPAQRWTVDLSRIPTGDGGLWLVSVREGCTNRVVSRKAAVHADAALVLSALEDALWSREAGN